MIHIDSLNSPFPMLSKPELCGHPFHGLVTSQIRKNTPGYDFPSLGTLSRPGGMLMDYKLPRRADAWAIKLDGVPDLDRTPEQLSADTANGYVWLDKVVVSGFSQVWGRGDSGICSFFWRNSSGKVWKISTYAPSELIPLHINVEVSEFGIVGHGPGATRPFTFAHGFEIDPELEAEFFRSATTYDRRVLMHDIKPDGSAAIFGFSIVHARHLQSRGAGDYSSLVHIPVPLGIYELSVTEGGDGWPVPAYTLLRSNAQCNGTGHSRLENIDGRVFESDGRGVLTTGTFTANSIYSVSNKIVSLFYSSDYSGFEEVKVSYERTSNSVETFVADSDPPAYTFVHQEKTLVKEIHTTYTGLYAGATFLSRDTLQPATVTFSQDDYGPMPPSDSLFPLGGDVLIEDDLTPIQTFEYAVMVDGYIPYPYTARMYGSIQVAGETVIFGNVHYPGGVSAGGPSVSIHSPYFPIYRSYNPVTGEVSARSEYPVCYV